MSTSTAPSSAAAPAGSPERIQRLAWGFAPLFAIDAAIANGLFDTLAEAPLSLSALAARAGVAERGLKALLPALAAFGLLRREGETFALTEEAARYLVSTSPSTLTGMIRHLSHQLLEEWRKLPEVVRSGRPAMPVNTEAAGSVFFANFDEALFPMNRPAAVALAQHLALGGRGRPVRVLDLAAGSGVWGITLAESAPNVTVRAVDWPAVLPVTRRMVERHGLTGRFTFVGGDLASADFGTGHDVAVLGHILHSEGERRGRALLRRCHEALAPGGEIVIAEFLVEPDRSGPLFGLLFALNMLIHTEEGDTFSFPEIAAWLEEAGFEAARTLDVPAPSPLILARRR
jgi:ubiquinone/menaquinone biosynthesis C-methylase UbiE